MSVTEEPTKFAIRFTGIPIPAPRLEALLNKLDYGKGKTVKVAPDYPLGIGPSDDGSEILFNPLNCPCCERYTTITKNISLFSVGFGHFLIQNPHSKYSDYHVCENYFSEKDGNDIIHFRLAFNIENNKQLVQFAIEHLGPIDQDIVDHDIIDFLVEIYADEVNLAEVFNDEDKSKYILPECCCIWRDETSHSSRTTVSESGEDSSECNESNSGPPFKDAMILDQSDYKVFDGKCHTDCCGICGEQHQFSFSCGHTICGECLTRLHKPECYYCRQFIAGYCKIYTTSDLTDPSL